MITWEDVIRKHADRWFKKELLKKIEKGYFLGHSTYDKQNSIILMIFGFQDFYQRYPYSHRIYEVSDDIVIFDTLVSKDGKDYTIRVNIDIKKLLRKHKIEKINSKI